MSTPRQCSSTNVLYNLQGIHAPLHPLKGPSDFEKEKIDKERINRFLDSHIFYFTA